MDRRKFMRVAGFSLGFGALYHVLPSTLTAEDADIMRFLGVRNGEKQTPFSFIQLSDTHVGFSGPPNPLGTAAFRHAVATINALPHRPDLVLFTGDLTQDSENKDEHATRMKAFREIAGALNVPLVKAVPGEHDAGLDGGQLFREHFGETSYSFDHRGIHFIALDNVSRARPEVGAERIAWLKRDLARFSRTTPIIVFTHRPLFDLKPEWEWFTSDGDEVMNALAAYENVTVLYGHIHREHEHTEGHAHHLAARSLIFAFPDPASGAPKKPVPFDKDKPFANLGLRVVQENGHGILSAQTLPVGDVELSLREFSGTEGIQQILRTGDL